MYNGLTYDESTAIGSFIDGVGEIFNNNTIEIPFPLKREVAFQDGIITVTVNYGKLNEQMKCWTENNLRDKTG